jgi:hypothetical protein
MYELRYIINKLKKIIGVFVGFSCIILLGILIFKGLTVRRFYKSFGDKGLNLPTRFGLFGSCNRNILKTKAYYDKNSTQIIVYLFT